MGVQCSKNPNFKKIKTPNLGVSGKTTFGCSPHGEYYKGEGGYFPQIWAVVSLVHLCMLVIHLCTKSASITH
jgi:hypothetical protein